MAESGQLVKVLVRLEPEAERETEHWWAESETLWPPPVDDDAYELRNIAWGTDAVHHRDIVRCHRTEDGSRNAEELRRSPSTTLRAATSAEEGVAR